MSAIPMQNSGIEKQNDLTITYCRFFKRVSTHKNKLYYSSSALITCDGHQRSLHIRKIPTSSSHHPAFSSALFGKDGVVPNERKPQ